MNGYAGGGQAPFTPGFSQSPFHTGPPPAKKARSAAVITRYPPPPGYQSRPQQLNPYQQSGNWPQSLPLYNHPQPSFPAWQAPAFLPQANYPPPQFHQPPQPSQFHQPPQPVGYPAQQPATTGHLPPTQFFPSARPQAPQPSPVWQAPFSAPQTTSHTHWQHHNPQQQTSSPSAIHQPNGGVAAALLDGNGEPYSPEAEDTELEEQYWDQSYYAKYPDEIASEFSIGTILWKQPLATKHALPSTFQQAELEANDPRPPHAENEESVSEYFVRSRRHKALLSVRQTECWNEAKNDLIFKEFPTTAPVYLTTEELISTYKDRSDPSWDLRSASSTPEWETPAPYAASNSDAGSEVNGHVHHDALRRRSQSSGHSYQADMLGNLEASVQRREPTLRRESYSRTSSNASGMSRTSSWKAAPTPVRVQEQESILAALGVTGSPKAVVPKPRRALGPGTSHHAADHHERTPRQGRQNAVTNNPGGLYGLPPPPPPTRNSTHGYLHAHRNGQLAGRPSSSNSHRTAPGSDFDGMDIDHDRTPRPGGGGHTGSRKRAYEDCFEDGTMPSRGQHPSKLPRTKGKNY